ncbi:MAG: hypothetical protein ACO3MV_06520 [Flavobacteriales bacterium]
MKFSRITFPCIIMGMLLTQSCTQLTQSTKLAEGPVVLAIDTVRAHVDVDTTRSLIGMSSTTHILGIIRVASDNEFADYPGIQLGFGGPIKEKKAAVYNALEGANADVLVNPKYIVREQRAFLFRKTTVQVAGFGGKLVFE